MVRKFALCSIVLCMSAGMAQATILVNGGFEDGDTGQLGSVALPGWNSWGGSGWHHDDAGNTLDTKAMKLWWDDAGMWQDFSATAGKTYDFSAQVLSVSGDPLTLWNFLIKAEFYDSNIGTSPGDELLAVELDKFYGASDPVDTWVEIGGSVTAPAGADTGRVVLLMVDWQDGVGGAINFDNVSVTPEPATLALLALGGVVMLRRRS